MTTTTKTSTGPKALPWSRYSEDVDRQIAAGVAREAARGFRTTTVNGTPSYRDAGSSECYTVGYGGERHYQTRPATPVKMATDPQKSYLRDLVVKVGRLPGHVALDLDTEIDAMTSRQASAAIDRCLATIKAAPVVSAPAQTPPATPARARLNFAEILDGNYAIDEGDDLIKFYRVSTSKSGFKNVQVRASDALYMQYGKAGIAILHRIVTAGLAESQMLFSTKMDACWMCGRSLTDKESRARGMGPDCASK